MKSFKQFMNEDYASLEKDMAAWKQRKQSAMQPQTSSLPKSDPDWASKMHDKFNAVLNRRDAPKTVSSGPVDTTGANSPFADPSVKSYTPRDTVTPDKPKIGKDPAVKKALAAKGYGETGKKITAIPKNTGVAKADTPVGSLPQKKTVPVPIPKARPADLRPKQTFKQAFASAKEGSTFEWEGKKYVRKTKKR